MTFEEKVNRSYELKERLAEIDTEKERLQEELEEVNSALLSEMKERGTLEENVGDIYVNLMRKETIGYDDVDKVIGYLEDNGLGRLLRIKRELDKKAISKEVKSNNSLADALAGMTSKKVTEYIVVTNSDNHQKMLEHIGKAKK